MKRKHEGCNGEETVKKPTSAGTLHPDKHLVEPHQVTAVQLLTPVETGSLLQESSGVSAAQAVTAPTSDGLTVPGYPCILRPNITYTLPISHTSPYNIILAPQVPITSTSCISTLNSTTLPTSVPTGAVFSPDNTTIPFANSTLDNTLPSYSSNTVTTTYSPSTTTTTNTSYSYPFNTCNTSSASVSPRAEIKTNNYKANQESLTERQQRLSERFNALIRAKIIELVTIRGLKKTICPSEVARALSPKAWRDLMPAVRNIGGQLVKEGIILVTQRGAIVDLSVTRGPVRFGLAK